MPPYALPRSRALAPVSGLLGRVEVALAGALLVWTLYGTARLLQRGWSYTADDAYITLRYARNLVEGHGIVWNVGDAVPVEGYSNFLFVLLGAAALKVGLDPVIVLKAVSCAAIVPTCSLLYILARRWLSPLAAALPALFLTSYNGQVYWARSGLETSVFQLFLVAATTAFVLGLDAPSEASGGRRTAAAPRARLHLVAAISCLLAALTRPEGPVIALVLGLTAVAHDGLRWLHAKDEATRWEVRRAFLGTVRAFATGFLLPYAVYFAWRVIHFERLLPNTVYCKHAYTGDPWELDQKFWSEAKPLILLAFVQDPRKLGARALPLFLVPFAYAVILYHADPIIGHHSRHFLAALALVVVASSMGLANIAALQASFAGSRRRGVSHLIADALVVGASLAWAGSAKADVTKDLESGPYDSLMRERDALGRYLDGVLSPRQTYVIGDTGVVPYRSHANVIDAFCLNSRELTSAPISFSQPRFIDWIFERAPDFILVASDDERVLRPHGDYGFYPKLIAHPRFQAEYQVRPGRKYGYPAGWPFFYWIFERKPL